MKRQLIMAPSSPDTEGLLGQPILLWCVDLGTVDQRFCLATGSLHGSWEQQKLYRTPHQAVRLLRGVMSPLERQELCSAQSVLPLYTGL